MNEKINKLKMTFLKRRAAYNGDAFGHIDDEGRYISYRAKNTEGADDMLDSAKKYKKKIMRRKIK